MLEFIQTRWNKTSPRSKTGWKYLGIGLFLLGVLSVIRIVPFGVVLLVGIFGVGLTVIGVALIIWGSSDIDDLRSFRS